MARARAFLQSDAGLRERQRLTSTTTTVTAGNVHTNAQVFYPAAFHTEQMTAELWGNLEFFYEGHKFVFADQIPTTLFENQQAFHGGAFSFRLHPTLFANAQAFRTGASISEDPLVSEAGTLHPASLAPINAGLVFCLGSHPAGSLHLGTDLVTGNAGTLLASSGLAGVNTSHGTWQCLTSSSLLTGGAHWPNSTQLRTVTNKRTLAFHGTIDAFDIWSALISVPYAADTWVQPWMSMSLRRQSSTGANINTHFATGGTGYSSVNSVGGFTTGTHWYVVTLDGDAGLAQFYVDGVQLGGPVTIAIANVDWGANQPVAVFNRSGTSQGEGTVGKCFTAAIWNRVLSGTEISSLVTAPQQMFKPGESTPDPDPDPDPEPDPGEPVPPTTVVNVTTATTLPVLNAIPANTLIQLADGTYSLGGAIIPKAGQYWRGNTADKSAVILSGGNHRAFDGSTVTAAGIVLKSLTITGHQCGKGATINNTIFAGQQDELAKIGAIENAVEWQVLDCAIQANACSGLRIGNGTRVARCSITGNAHVGIQAGRDAAGNALRARNLVIEDNIIRNNGQWRLDPVWDSGGVKLIGDATPTDQNPALNPARDNMIRRNEIADNWGPGVWLFWDVLETIVHHNSIHGNHHSGVLLEACGGNEVHHNQIGDNCLTLNGDAAFNTNAVAFKNAKRNLVERNLLVVNRGRAAVLTQHNRVGSTGGGGSPNVGPIEPVNGSATQVAISVGTSPRQPIIGYGWGANDAQGGAGSAATRMLARVQLFIAKLSTDINCKVLRFFTPENHSGFSGIYKPYWDLVKNHGFTDIFTSSFVHRADPDPTMAAVATGIKNYHDDGVPIGYMSLQNEPDGGPVSNGILLQAVPPGFAAGAVQVNSGNSAAVAARYQDLRNQLNSRGLSAVKILSYEWRHPPTQAPSEFDFMNSAGKIPSVIAGFCYHIYDKGPNNAMYDSRYLAAGIHGYSTETGNNGSPNCQARGVAGLNHGSRMEIIHYAVIPDAVPSGDQNGQSLLDFQGNPRPWYGAIQAIWTNLQQGSIVRLCESNDRPAGIPAAQAERMIILAPRMPRQVVSVSRRTDGRWQVVAVNATSDVDTPSSFVGGHFAAVTQQLTVTIPELAGVDVTFTARRAAQTSSAMSAPSTVNCKSGVLRFTLAAGESIGMTSNVAGTPGSPFSPQGGVYTGWFTGTENTWQDNSWLMLTNGTFESTFADHACSNNNQACTGLACSTALCNVAGTECNTLSTPTGDTLGGNFLCFIPQAADNHFNAQTDDTFRIASGTANKWPFSTGHIQLGNPTGFVPDWSVIPTWSSPPGTLGLEVLAQPLVNVQAFYPAMLHMSLPAQKLNNAQVFHGHTLGGGVQLLAMKHTNVQSFKAVMAKSSLLVTKVVNAQAFGAHELSGGENPLVRLADSWGWETASNGNTSNSGSTSLPVGFNGRNAAIFENITIPQGATINSATIKFTSVGAAADATNWQIRVEQTEDPAPIVAGTANFNISTRNLGTSDVAWNSVPAWTDGQSDANTTTTSFAVKVQVNINLPGWVSGNALLVTWRANTTTGYRSYATKEHATFTEPMLTISWT